MPDARIRYGRASSVQYADLRLPKAEVAPAGLLVVIFVHGGGWTADWSKDYATPYVEAAIAIGIVTWEPEFRRFGNTGGGYPGTFQDIAAAADMLRTVAS